MTNEKSQIKINDRNQILEAWGCSRRGASHHRNNTVCEDANIVASGTYYRKPWILGASADGLGGNAYYLSQYGSQIAVNLLPYFAKQFCSMIRQQSRNSQQISSDSMSDLLGKLSRKWLREIKSDFKINGRGCSLKTEDISRAYATTLLFTLYYENTWLFIQLGDGDIYYHNKSHIEQPERIFPLDIKTGATDALSVNNAGKWRCKTHPVSDGDMVFICSDGFSDSFEVSDDDSEMIKNLYEQIQKYGNDEIYPQISTLLDTISVQGSQDDMTMVSISVKMV